MELIELYCLIGGGVFLTVFVALAVALVFLTVAVIDD